MDESLDIDFQPPAEIIPFQSYQEMIDDASRFFDLRELLRSEPDNKKLLNNESAWTSYWHKRYELSKESNPLSTYMHSKNLSPIDCEILMDVIRWNLGSYNDTSVSVSNPIYTARTIKRRLAINMPLYTKRIIYQSRIKWYQHNEDGTRTKLQPDRFLLLDPFIIKNILKIKPHKHQGRIVATSEKDLLKKIKQLFNLSMKRAECILSEPQKKNSNLYSMAIIFSGNIDKTIENFPEWNLSALLDVRYIKRRLMVLHLIGKYLNWIDSESILCTKLGLSAACAKLSGEISPHFNEHLKCLIDNKWIQPVNDGHEFDPENIKDNQRFELHPEAVKRLGLI